MYLWFDYIVLIFEGPTSEWEIQTATKQAIQHWKCTESQELRSKGLDPGIDEATLYFGKALTNTFGISISIMG